MGISCELLESDFLKCSVGFPFMRSKSKVRGPLEEPGYFLGHCCQLFLSVIYCYAHTYVHTHTTHPASHGGWVTTRALACVCHWCSAPGDLWLHDLSLLSHHPQSGKTPQTPWYFVNVSLLKKKKSGIFCTILSLQQNTGEYVI